MLPLQVTDFYYLICYRKGKHSIVQETFYFIIPLALLLVFNGFLSIKDKIFTKEIFGAITTYLNILMISNNNFREEEHYDFRY